MTGHKGSFNIAKGSFAAIHSSKNRNLSTYSAKPILSPSNTGKPQENLFHLSR